MDIQSALYKEPDGDKRRALVRQWLLAKCGELRGIGQEPITFLGDTCRVPWCIRCGSRHWPTREVTCVALAKREKNATSSGGSSLPAAPGKVLSGFANVLDFLSMRSWPDGSPRLTGTITLSTEGASWKACVKCPNSASVAFVTAETPDGLLKALDRGLESDTLEWREDRFQGGSGKRSR